MDYIDLLNKIDNNKLKNINLFVIDEPYFLNLSIEVLKKDFLGSDFEEFNFENLDFNDMDIESFENSIETLPLMSDKRLIIVNNFDISKDSLKKYEEILNFISNKFEKFNPTTFIVFIYRGDKLFKGKFVKSLEKYGDIYTFSRLDRIKFMNFVKRYFLNKKIKLNDKSIALIVDRLRYLDRDSNKNLFEIENELSKLSNNIKSGNPSYDEIEESIIDTFEEKIFGLLDYMSSKDVKKSIQAFYSMQSQDQYMIYYMIIRQIRNMICVKDCKERKVNMQTGMKYCGIGNFEYGKLERFVSKFTLEELLLIHSLCYESEKKIKTSKGKIEDLVERIIFEFCMR